VGERRTVAELLADRLIALALGGSVEAFRMIADRTEGADRQRIGLDGDLSVNAPYGPVLTLSSFRNWTDEQLDAHYAECQEVIRRSKATRPQ